MKVTSIGRTMTILPERVKDVDYILSTIERKPVFVSSLREYQDYLWNPAIPVLLTDNREMIIDKLATDFDIIVDASLSLNKLKDILNRQIENRQKEKIAEQVKDLKDYKLYQDIEETYDSLNNTYEPSLFFEWNTWRAMTMLDGGSINANLKFDDEGKPMNTALGKMPDIVCDYGDFDVTVEVSLSSGALQFKMEGEPVPRHIGLLKEKTKKPTYCFFVAPTINPATIAHFYSLYIANIEMYGGRCNIIPLTLSTFRNMLKKAVNAEIKPNPSDIKRLFDISAKYVKDCIMNGQTETDWYNKIKEKANNWLSGIEYDYNSIDVPMAADTETSYIKH